jgi:hypothetical protein
MASVSSIKLGFLRKEGTNFLPGAFLAPLRGGGAIRVDSSSWRDDDIYSNTEDYYC